MAVNTRFAVGIHLLVFLASRDDQAASSTEVARSVSTHPVVVRRLLRRLVQAGLVVTRRGATGGFSLARNAMEIRLDEIYRAVESQSPLHTPAHPPTVDCSIACGVTPVVEEVFQRVRRALERELSQSTLHEIVCKARGQPAAEDVPVPSRGLFGSS